MRIIIPSYTSRLGLPAKACVHTRLYLRRSISASYRSALAMAAAYEGGFILLVDNSSAWSHGPKTIQPYQHTYGTSHASQAKDLKMGHEDREWYCSLNINPDVHLPTVPPTTAITHPAISTPTSYVDTVKAVPVIQWCTKTKRKNANPHSRCFPAAKVSSWGDAYATQRTPSIIAKPKTRQEGDNPVPQDIMAVTFRSS